MSDSGYWSAKFRSEDAAELAAEVARLTAENEALRRALAEARHGFAAISHMVYTDQMIARAKEEVVAIVRLDLAAAMGARQGKGIQPGDLIIEASGGEVRWQVAGARQGDGET